GGLPAGHRRTGEPRPPYREAVEAFNARPELAVVACDVPTPQPVEEKPVTALTVLRSEDGWRLEDPWPVVRPMRSWLIWSRAGSPRRPYAYAYDLAELRPVLC
ncbi:MAG: hypothetical protein M3276_04765, partial [Actinomycetota bacterium]|nr:hypothetical protein [Actinomycetota bacterium]